MSASRDVDGPAFAGPMLGAVAGFVDGIDYPRYHVFGAAMTGNTALIGIRVAGAEHASALLAFVPIVGFFFGCMLARALVDRLPATWPLLIEAALLAFAAATPPAWIVAFVATAFAMGIQNTTFATFGGVKANTAFVTGDLDRLAQAVVRAFKPAAKQPDGTIGLVVPLLLAYVAGGFAGATALLRVPHPLWIPAAVVAALALARPGTRARPDGG